jgi:hypothetical protein
MKMLSFEMKPSANTNCSISYSSSALRNDIDRLQNAFRAYQNSRKRDAIYQFLGSVYEIVTIWALDGKAVSRCRSALAIAECELAGPVEPYRALITVAARPKSIDDRTMSKWTRVLQFAAGKLPSVPLQKFVKRHGGINDCAAEFTRRDRRRLAKEKRGALKQKG